jgi:hypothetical protein
MAYGCNPNRNKCLKGQEELNHILEAAFRHALTYNPKPKSTLYYLTFTDNTDTNELRDPSSEIFNRLKGIEIQIRGKPHHVELKKGVNVLRKGIKKISPKKAKALAHVKRLEKGVICRVVLLEWKSKTAIRVMIDTFSGPQLGSSHDVVLRKRDGKWAADIKSVKNELVY